MGQILDQSNRVVRYEGGRTNYLGPEVVIPPNAIHVTSLEDVVTRLRRHRKAIAAFVIAGTLFALLISALQPRKYRSTALIEVKGFNDNILNTRDVDPTASSLNYPMDAYVQTQIKIVTSYSVLGRAIDKLNLQKHPELLGSPGILKRALLAAGLGEEKTEVDRQDLIDWVSDNITVRVPGETRMMEVSFEARDPQLAANLVNAVVSEYVDSTVGMHNASSERTTAWLTSQIAELRSKVQKSQGELQSYAQRTGLLFTSEKDNIAEARLRQLQESLSKAHEVRVAQEAQFQLVNTAPADSLPEVLDDQVLREYQTRLADLRRQLAEVRPVLAPSHYKMQQLEAEIAEMQGAFQRKRGDIVSRIKNQYDAAAQQEKILARNYATQVQLVSGQSVQVVQYDILKRELDTNRQLYESMLQKLREVRIASAMRVSDISVVDEAKAAERPFWPNHKAFGAAGFGLGAFVGMAFALIPRRRRWRTDAPSELVRQLGLPELGLIPLLRSAKNAQSTIDVHWKDSEQHSLAEAFRATMVSILLGSRGAYDGEHPHVIVVSSCGSGDGRTTVAANLAIALTEANNNVLLIDADLRNPQLHHLFGIDNTQGLTSILSDTKPCQSYTLQQIGRPAALPNLHVLTSGPQSAGSAGLLHSARTTEFMEKARSMFDIVIIDAPPVLAFADARTLAKLSDGVAFVIRPDETSPDDIFAALQRFAEDGTPVLGSIAIARDKATNRRSEKATAKRRGSVNLVPSFLQANMSSAVPPLSAGLYPQNDE
jgi:polysaccharide biosynthesis transport protein